MTRAQARSALLLSLLAAACSGSSPATGPVPVSMTPAHGTAVAPLPVLIAGRGFDAATQTDFQKGSAALDASFSARLLPAAGGAPVVLEEVRLTERRQLEARVPAGIPRGSYSLEVIDPSGKTGLLAQAFRVVTSAESVASFRVVPAEAAHAGVPFLVALTAVDAAGLVVDGFTDAVQLSDLTGTVSPTTSGPFALGRLSIRVAVSSLAAADRLTVRDPLGHSGTSDPFPVVPGPAVALAFPPDPVAAPAGACSPPIWLELRDVMNNATTASEAIDIQLQSSPAGSFVFYGDTGCSASTTTIAISAGSTGASFRFRGSTSGEIRAVPAGLPSATQSVTLSP